MLAPSAAVYNQLFLHLYDFYVLGFSNTFAWHCPTRSIRELYNKNLSNQHLDVGVGTGYFLDKCQFPNPEPKITLVDLNPNSLEVAAKRIARYKPQTYLADIFKPLPLADARFDSVGLNYLFHCLPGPFSKKEVVFKNIEPYLNPGATVFGSTIMVQNSHGYLARKLLAFYNSKGIFGNLQDTREDLEAALSRNFSSYSLRDVGSVVFFEGKK
jgi:ubiquinone/menaquinone biosynthesis C-methylase UbiE